MVNKKQENEYTEAFHAAILILLQLLGNSLCKVSPVIKYLLTIIRGSLSYMALESPDPKKYDQYLFGGLSLRMNNSFSYQILSHDRSLATLIRMCWARK